jgi:hypothetical protein
LDTDTHVALMAGKIVDPLNSRIYWRPGFHNTCFNSHFAKVKPLHPTQRKGHKQNPYYWLSNSAHAQGKWVSNNHNTIYQPLLSLTSIYLQFIMPDAFKPHSATFSGSMFGSTLHVKMCRPKNYKMSRLSLVLH